MRPNPMEREIGRVAARPPMPDNYATYLLDVEARWRIQGGIYGLFQEMEEKDAHLFATLQTRKNAVAACPWRVVWGDTHTRGLHEKSQETSGPTTGLECAAIDSSTETARKISSSVRALERDQHGGRHPEQSFSAECGVSPERQKLIADFVGEALSAIPNLSEGVYQLLDAFAKGFSVLEVIWRVDPRLGVVRIDRLIPRWPAHFVQDEAGRWYLLEEAVYGRAAQSGDEVAILPRPGEITPPWGQIRAIPPRKFVFFRFQPHPAAPYGSALCAKAYWYYWLKKNNLRFWSLYNEKFGAPTAVARYGAGTTEAEIQRLSEVVAQVQSDLGVVIPESVSMELLEARRAGAASTYRELADWCNDEISKLVLGQTLTTSEGRRSGSLALGRVHEAVRHEYVAADAYALGQALTHQLVRWLVDFNFGVEAPAPQLVFDCEAPQDYQAELEVDRGLIQLGVALAPEYFYAKYRRPMPSPHSRALKYDDANLYQYHLQYGILTINEVRAALGLPSVPWGERPPARLNPAVGPEADATAQKEPTYDLLEADRDTLPH